MVFPTALVDQVTTQYNNGSSGLNVPNMTPDFVLKGSFDNKVIGGRAIHFDIGTVMRTFRSWDGISAWGKIMPLVGASSANFNVEVRRACAGCWTVLRVTVRVAISAAFLPDVIVRADGSISPIHSYSWVSGYELAPNKATGLYFYYSGLYAQKNAALLNSDGTCCVGFGFPGASNAADRLIEEATGGYSRVLWKYENLGSVPWGLQFAACLGLSLGGWQWSKVSQR